MHVVEKNEEGIVISGTKAIVTGGPYMHELLVMPNRNMGQEDAAFAVCCAVRVDEPGITISRPAVGLVKSWSMATRCSPVITVSPPP